MTTVTGDLRNVLGEKAQGTVRWQSVGVRPGVTYAGEVIDDWQSAPVKDGKFSVNVEPGPARIRVVSGSTNWTTEVVVPDKGTITLGKLIEGQTEYSPRVVSEVEKYARAAEASSNSASGSAAEAEKSARGAKISADEAKGYAEDSRESSLSAASAMDSSLELASNTAALASQAKVFADSAEDSYQGVEDLASVVQGQAREIKGYAESATAMQAQMGEHSKTSARSAAEASASAALAKDHADRAGEASGRVDSVVRDAATALEQEVRDSSGLAKDYADQAAASAGKAAEAARAEVDKLKGGAPAAFDTLGEIAAELGKNESERSVLANSIAAKADADHKHTIADITNLPAITNLSTANTIMQRDSSGRVNINSSSAPTASYHVTHKKYVDEEVQKAKQEGVAAADRVVASVKPDLDELSRAVELNKQQIGYLREEKAVVALVDSRPPVMPPGVLFLVKE